jgi:hypothetical protein
MVLTETPYRSATDRADCSWRRRFSFVDIGVSSSVFAEFATQKDKSV